MDLTDQRSRPGPVNRHRPPGGAGSRALRVRKTVADAGIVSPLTLGGTYGALVIATDDADTIWQRALEAGAEVFHPIGDTFWGERFGQFIDPFGIAGASRNTSATSPTTRSSKPPQKPSAEPRPRRHDDESHRWHARGMAHSPARAARRGEGAHPAQRRAHPAAPAASVGAHRQGLPLRDHRRHRVAERPVPRALAAAGASHDVPRLPELLLHGRRLQRHRRPPREPRGQP